MRALRVIGVDLSLSGTGIAEFGDEEVTWKTSPGEAIERRLASIRDVVLMTAKAHDRYCDLVTIEDFVTRSPAASTLGMVHGVVRVALMEAGIPFVLVPPASLKKYIAGKGNAKKDDMRMETFKRFGRDIKDDNQCDAFGLRAMALDAFGCPLVDMPTVNRLALEKVAWPALEVDA